MGPAPVNERPHRSDKPTNDFYTTPNSNSNSSKRTGVDYNGGYPERRWKGSSCNYELCTLLTSDYSIYYQGHYPSLPSQDSDSTTSSSGSRNRKRQDKIEYKVYRDEGEERNSKVNTTNGDNFVFRCYSLSSSSSSPSSSMFNVSPSIIKFNCGMLGGIGQAGIFNPWDRALYLSVKERRPFLHRENWRQPYQGFLQAIVVRTLSAGLYFPLEDMFLPIVSKALGTQSVNDYSREDSEEGIIEKKYSHNFLSVFIAGNLAGAINGVILNPINAIKYHTWGHDKYHFSKTAVNMWKHGGITPFLKGTQATIYRDLVFGGLYSLLRNYSMWMNLDTESTREIREEENRRLKRTETTRSFEVNHAENNNNNKINSNSHRKSLSNDPSIDKGNSAENTSVKKDTRHKKEDHYGIFHSLSQLVERATRPNAQEFKIQRHDTRRTVERKRSEQNFFNFVVNVVAAGIATIISGPLNYVRNITYATPADMEPPSTYKILKDLRNEVMKETTFQARCSVFQDRLRLGWGTARVAVGMGFVNTIYELCKSQLLIGEDYSE